MALDTLPARHQFRIVSICPGGHSLRASPSPAGRQRPDGHGLEAGPLGIDAADHDLLDREMRGQKPAMVPVERVISMCRQASRQTSSSQFAELIHRCA